MVFEILLTDRLHLRKLTPEVYTFIHETYSDEDIMDFLALQSKTELEEEKDKFAKGMATWNRSFVNFQLIEKESSQIVGSCGFHTWFPQHRRAEIGYCLFEEELKNKGYMSEALFPILQYGFEKLHLNRVEALVAPNNEPSLKLLARFGFVKEGLLRQHYAKNNRIEDSVFFALLKSEFKPR